MVITSAFDGVTIDYRKRKWSPTGTFVELHNSEARFDAAQVSLSTIDQYVLRGIHFTTCPPGQRKTVTCIRGSIIDITIDLREGSLTYLKHQMIVLRGDETDVATLHIAPWVGHAIYAVKDSTMLYTHSVLYDPATERTLWSFDPALGIEWTGMTPKGLNKRDENGLTLAELVSAGDLPLAVEL